MARMTDRCAGYSIACSGEAIESKGQIGKWNRRSTSVPLACSGEAIETNKEIGKWNAGTPKMTCPVCARAHRNAVPPVPPFHFPNIRKKSKAYLEQWGFYHCSTFQIPERIQRLIWNNGVKPRWNARRRRARDKPDDDAVPHMLLVLLAKPKTLPGGVFHWARSSRSPAGRTHDAL